MPVTVRSALVACILFGCVGLLLQIIGISTSHWVSPYGTHFGLWQVCHRDGDCSYLIPGDSRVTTSRALGTIGAVSALVCVVVLTIYTHGRNFVCVILSIVAAFVSGLCSISCWGVFLQYVGPSAREYLSWSFGVLVAGSVCYLVLGVLLVIVVCVVKKNQCCDIQGRGGQECRGDIAMT